MKNKYQTKTQLLLSILLEEIEEDLALSKQRIEVLTKQKDFETLEVECEFNNTFTLRKEKIKSLIESERNSHSSTPYVVQIGYVNSTGKTVINEISVSNPI